MPRPPTHRVRHLPGGLAAALCALSIAPGPARAQPRQPDAARLLRAIDRLPVVGRALYVAAHPDDENTRLLAWLANERLVRTAYLSLTRGDGGQNLIGAEQGPLLGLIRTQELLAARRIDGAEQLFTRARDFGYSKGPEETLATWGKDEVLADVVWAIRRFRPDVIISRFPVRGLETHGHHTASAILAEEAFRRAADPGYRPDQLRDGVTVWQARRIVWNKSSFFIKPGEDLSGFLALDIGAYNAVLGESYGEMAARSRSMHKSQGFGAASSRGALLEYFQTIAGEPARTDPFDGVDLTWRRVRGGAAVIAALDRVRARFHADRPHEVIPALVEARRAIEELPDNPWKREKLDEVERLIVDCAGLHLEATADEPQAVRGGPLTVTATALARTAAAVDVVEVRLPFGRGAPVAALPAPNTSAREVKETITVPRDHPLSNPYWLVEPPQKGLHPVADPRLVGLPESPPALAVEFRVRAGGATFPVTRPVLYKWVDPVAGERSRAVTIAAAVTLQAEPSVLLFTDGTARALRVSARAVAAGGARGKVRVVAPDGFRAEPAALPFAIADKGGEQELRFSISAGGPRGPSGAAGTLRLFADLDDGSTSDRSALIIDHPHIPLQALYPPAEVNLVRFDVQRGRTRIGYIAGPGDDVPQALRQVGYDVTMLGGPALRDAPLDPYEAIVVGVRAYNTNPQLPLARERLMEYVRAGGTLVAQYSTANRLSKVPAQIGPFPFDISQERVTDEDAEVTFEPPGHPVLSSPNAITAADFAGWVQERGLYFAGTWDARYETPLSMHDAGEPARRGGLLVARLGRGAFVYTGLSFFRQLPAGVPGAFRLLANLIAYGAR